MDKLALLEEQTDTINKLRMRVDNSKAELDAHKKLLDQAMKKRDQIFAIGEDALREQTPLFPDDDAKKNGAVKPKKSKAAVNEAAISQAGGKEQWRHLPVSDAIKIGSVINGLEVLDPPVRTCGDLEVWLQHGGSLLKLPGVGEEKRDKALDQWAAFFKAHPEFAR